MAISKRITKKESNALWLDSKSGYHIIDGFEHIHCFNFAKPIFGGYFLFKDKDWELHQIEDSEFINTNRIQPSQNLAAIFQSIKPFFGIKLKGYVIGLNFVVNVDFPCLIKLLKIDEQRLFNYNFNIEDPTCIAVYSMISDRIVLIEDVGLPGADLVPIKVFGKKWGFISLADFNDLNFDNYIIPPIFDFAVGFIEGYSKVKFDGFFGFINTEGKTIIPFEYDDALSFQKGIACVAKSNFKHFPKNIDNDFTWFNVNINNALSSRNGGGVVAKATLRKIVNPYINLFISQNGLKRPEELPISKFSISNKKEWEIFERNYNSSGYKIDPIQLDFDLTQEEIDLFTGSDSLYEKYGGDYYKWKKECQRAIAFRKMEQSKMDMEDNLTYKDQSNKKNDIDFNEGWEWNID